MTNREFFEKVIALVNDNDNELAAKAFEEIAKLDKANERKKTTPNKTQTENEEIKKSILEVLANGSMTARAVYEKLSLSSTSKASSLLSQLVRAGKVTSQETKLEGYKSKVNVYTLVK